MEAPHLGVSSGGVEVDGTVFVRASLTVNVVRKQLRKKHRIEENYSSEVSPPSREKKARIGEKSRLE